MLRTQLVVAVCAIGLAFAPVARPLAAEEPITFHDFSTMEKGPYGPYPEARAVVTGANSFVTAVVPAGYRQPPHRHNQEQFTLGVAGTLDYSIGGTPHRLGSHGIGLMPSNVPHGMLNESKEPAVALEFQPVRRPEWLPPHPQVPPQPQSPEAMPLPADRQVTLDFDLSSGGWHATGNGARSKSLVGKTIQAVFWDLSAANTAVDLTERPSQRERFVWVLNGRATASVGSSRREIGREMLIVIAPSAKNVRLQSLGTAGTEIVVFESTDTAKP